MLNLLTRQNCQEKFDGLAADPRFRFFGNVSIGSTTSPTTSTARAYTYPDAVHIPLSDLVPYYTTVLFTYGSSLSNPLSRTEHSSSSPAPLGNVIPALAFVSWYNGHPAYAHLTDQLDLSGIDEATVIGHGNVAIDVARMLLKDPEALAKTDMPTPVVDRLRESRVRRVTAVGRRGPAQVSFTTKEFREMVNLPGVAFTPVDSTLMDDARGMVVGDRARKRLMDLMSKAGAKAQSDMNGRQDRTFELGFLKSPIAFLPSETDPSSSSSSTDTPKVSQIKWSLNTLLSPPPAPPVPPHPPAAPATLTDTTPSTTVVARPTGQETTTRSGLVIESVGYRSESLSLSSQGDRSGWAVPFDERRGRIMNDGGRVVDESGIMVCSPLRPAFAVLGSH
jgi:adrenodoxin-NADP+ reductase